MCETYRSGCSEFLLVPNMVCDGHIVPTDRSPSFLVMTSTIWLQEVLRASGHLTHTIQVLLMYGNFAPSLYMDGRNTTFFRKDASSPLDSTNRSISTRRIGCSIPSKQSHSANDTLNEAAKKGPSKAIEGPANLVTLKCSYRTLAPARPHVSLQDKPTNQIKYAQSSCGAGLQRSHRAR